MFQLFVVTQDRDRIYPLEKEFIHTTVQIVEGVCVGVNIMLAGLLLGTYDGMKEARRVRKRIKRFNGRNRLVFVMPGHSAYNSKSDWLEILAMYKEIEEREAELA